MRKISLGFVAAGLAVCLYAHGALAAAGTWSADQLTAGNAATFTWDSATTGDQTAIFIGSCRTLSITAEVSGAGTLSYFVVPTAGTATSGTAYATFTATSRSPTEIPSPSLYWLRPNVTSGASGTSIVRCQTGSGVVLEHQLFYATTIANTSNGLCLRVWAATGAPQTCGAAGTGWPVPANVAVVSVTCYSPLGGVLFDSTDTIGIAAQLANYDGNGNRATVVATASLVTLTASTAGQDIGDFFLPLAFRGWAAFPTVAPPAVLELLVNATGTFTSESATCDVAFVRV